MNEISDLKPNIIIGDTYEGVLTLDSWKGFQSRQGFYGLQDKKQDSEGIIKVTVEGKGDVGICTIQQVNSIKFLIDNCDMVRDSILVGLRNELPNLKEIYEDLIPEIDKIEDFKNVIGLSYLHIMASDKDDFAYIGFELGCNWDEEHGTGIMMHKGRVIAIGNADTSFDSWVTFDDNGTSEMATKNWNIANHKIQEDKQKNNKEKSWWKFW